MKWLHISDIHYNPKKDGRSSKQLRKKIVTYIEDKNIKVDNIFITGDFRNAAEQGHEDGNPDIPNVVEFIKSIASSAGVNKMENIHIIPGNHDLTRDNDFTRLINIRNSYNVEKGYFHEEDLEYLVCRFDFFKELASVLCPNGDLWTESMIPIHRYRCFEESNVLYLNSAITCGTNDDRNELVIGNEAVYDILEEIQEKNPDKPIIVLAHHGIEHFTKKEREALEKIFIDYPIVLYLCGDSHEVWKRQTNNITEITMGCIKNDMGVQTTFSVGEIREDGEFSIEVHIWDPKFSSWGSYTHCDKELKKWSIYEEFEEKKQASIITNNVPFPSIEHFVGRDDIITSLEENLIEKSPIVLHASPGMGKTEICRELFNRHAKVKSPYFKSIGWLFFRDNVINTFYKQFKNIKDNDLDIYWTKVKEYISNHKSELLLIIDNADDISIPDLTMLLSLECSIILTSRTKIERMFPIHVGKLSENECRELYRKHSKDIDALDSTLDQIIQLADNHTLSIELLSKTQYVSGKSSDEILKALLEDGFSLVGINEEISYTHNPEESGEIMHENVFIAHMAKIFKLAEIDDPEEQKILELFACMSYEAFPLEYVKECFELNNLTKLNKLVEKGWLKRDDKKNVYNMHPVVSAVIRHCKKTSYKSVERMIKWISNELSIRKDEMFVQKLWLFSHALSVANMFNEKAKSLGDLKHTIGRFYIEQGNYKMALLCYKESLSIIEMLFGKTNLNVALRANDIALVYIDLGEYSKALVWLQKSYEINEVMLSLDHPSNATTYNNFGLIYDHMGNYRTALEWYMRALEIDLKILGENHLSTATVYNNIGAIYDSLGDYELAIEFLDKAIEIRVEKIGKTHYNTAESYSNLAAIYEKIGMYSKAVELYSITLNIVESTFGTEHPRTAKIYSNVAILHDYLGKFDEAIKLNKKALEIREKIFGSNHPETATTYNNIGLVYDNLRNYKSAVEWYMKSLEYLENTQDNDAETASTYNNIGASYYGLEDFSKSMVWYRKALVIREKLFGKKHLDTAMTYSNMGATYYEMAHCNPKYAESYYKKANKWHIKAFKIRKEILGNDHPDTAKSYNGIALLLYKEGKHSIAKKYLKEALYICETKLGENHPLTKTVSSNMKLLYNMI